ncbi:GbsR/MarR family transcriptional regulator [Promicromonospora sp. NPDC057488]|uniref:GbsR/MarR family transcriptional regulator n=1 Tax=Promicromonospora sp. NPDC057488 TaxID=3346147 RepID=UPI0036704646
MSSHTPADQPTDSSTDQSTAQPADGVDEPVLDAAAEHFVEQFALTWGASHSPRMEGRIVGLLMIVDRPYLSSQQIAKLLKASAGAVSTSTRRLVETGFVKRHAVLGDRQHYFRVEDDIWGSFLASERAYLGHLRNVIDDGLAIAGEADGPHKRLVNARNYMEWLAGYHRKMLADWEAYRDAQPADGTGEP